MSLRLVLASASPRRRAILTDLGLDLDVLASGIDEEKVPLPAPPAAMEGEDQWAPCEAHAAAVATTLAEAKARDVARRVDAGAVVLAADTVVALPPAKLLGKPKDRGDAARMLALLGDREHLVVTAIVVITTQDGRSRSAHESSRVLMCPATSKRAQKYLESGLWEGKAGAYGIQDPGTPVALRSGSVTNVVGLPVASTVRLLAAAGLSALSDEAADSVERVWARNN